VFQVLLLHLVVKHPVVLFELIVFCSARYLACPIIGLQHAVVTLCAALHVILDMLVSHVLHRYVFCVHVLLLFA
jgi:hypothetical protein